jgi:hypothetical protein
MSASPEIDALVAQKKADADARLRAEAAEELKAKAKADAEAKAEAKRIADEKKQRAIEAEKRKQAVTAFAAGFAKVLIDADCVNPREIDDVVIDEVRRQAGL